MRRVVKRMRFASCLLVLWGAVLLPSAVAVSAERSTIAGTTAMFAESSGWVPVNLAEGLRVFPAEEPDGAPLAKMRVNSEGRLRAALLRAEQPNLADGQRAEWRTFSYDDATASSANSDVLPPGDYRLHVFTDQPAMLDLRAPGLIGHLVLTPAVYEPIKMGPLTLRPGTRPQTMIFGDSNPLASDGELLLDVRYTVGSANATISEFCAYPNGMDEAEGQAYEPGCPGGSSFQDPSFNYTASSAERAYSLTFGARAGQPGAGGNFIFAGDPPEVDAFAAWMPSDPTSFPPPEPPPALRPPPPAVPPTALPQLVSPRLAVRNAKASVRFRCTSRVTCAARVQLLPGAHNREVRVASGKGRTVRMPLSRILRRRLARKGFARATLRMQGAAVSEARRTLDRTIQLRGGRGQARSGAR